MSFRPQDAEIFRPYPDEIPWELLALAEPCEAAVLAYADADYMRVAKVAGEPVGVYVVRALEPTRFELCNLAVAVPWRGKKLGSWLLGHAIGLSESKGGREVLIRNRRPRGLFTRVGFAPTGSGIDLLLTLTPE